MNKNDLQSELHVIICQLTSTNSIDNNDKQIKKLLNSIPNLENVNIISFPENCFFMRMKEGEAVQYLTLDNDIFQFYKEFAKKNNLLIHFGATPLQMGDHKYNATVVVMPDGSIESPYQKIHLFDIQLENQKPVRESDAFTKGSRPKLISYLGWNLAFTVCYDLRFSELFLYYQLKGADVVFIPSAFLVETGRMHWEILNRARAIEGQYFVVSAAQGGTHSETRKTFGNSIAVDPWGNVIAQQKDDSKPSFIAVKLIKEVLDKVRKQIPMKDHRRMKVEFLDS
ncbi:MAG: nitrilase-related carbon-nitrogen hydrolase [Bdellovibrionota bacterium]